MRIFLSIIFVFFPVSIVADEVATLIYPPFKHTWGIHKGTEAKLDLLLGNATDFANPQGLAVTRLKSWDNPKSEKDDDEVTAYGVNSGRDQIIYNTSMYNLAIFGSSGSGKNQFKNPRGITADPSGNVFICDAGNRRVVHLFNEGKKLKWVDAFGMDILEEPHDVATTEADTIFVTDYRKGTIEIFTYKGKHIGTLGGLVKPTGIAVDHPKITKTRYGDREIFVIDSDGTQVRKLTYDGKVVATISASEIPNSGKMSYIALDFFNNAWITDSITCRIHKLDRNLRYIDAFGSCGTEDKQFENPTGIAIWRRFGQVIVAERRSAQYLWIGTDIKNFSAKISTEMENERIAVLSMFLTDRSYVSIIIKRDGKVVRKLSNRRRLLQGDNTLNWDLKDDMGALVPSGTYEIELKLEPTYSSFTYFEKIVSTKLVID